MVIKKTTDLQVHDCSVVDANFCGLFLTVLEQFGIALLLQVFNFRITLHNHRTCGSLLIFPFTTSLLCNGKFYLRIKKK